MANPPSPAPDPVRARLQDLGARIRARRKALGVNATAAAESAETFGIYERNARHLDLKALSPQEHDLWQALQAAFSGRGGHV